MPITGPSSYLPTTDLFLAHWLSANTALGAGGPMVLKDGVSQAGLATLRTTLANQRTAVVVAANALEGARADIEIKKAALLLRLNQFNNKLESLATGTRWVQMRPKAFTVSEGMGRVLPPLDDVADLWSRYELGVATTMLLLGGYTRATFITELASLKTAYTAWSSAENGLKLARAARNETQAVIYEILKQYRLRIPAEFAEGSAILETLPRLTPLPGHTPDPVALSAAWNATTSQANLSWTETTDSAVATVEVRASVGPDYDPEDETVLVTQAPSAPRTWAGDFGLAVPGAAATYKVYLLTAEGNERGSNAATVQRPVI